MERLTKKIFADGTIGLKNILDIEEINWSDADGKNKESTYCGKAIDRLAAYEDTGLAPAEVAELAKAKADGRLVVLPCKVGDTVFTIELDCKDNPDHLQMCFCWNKSCKECDKSYLRVWENRNKTADIRSIVAEMGLCGESGGFGKTVFLAREEAEAALRKEQEQ
jgi:hypothetical protein